MSDKKHQVVRAQTNEHLDDELLQDVNGGPFRFFVDAFGVPAAADSGVRDSNLGVSLIDSDGVYV